MVGEKLRRRDTKLSRSSQRDAGGKRLWLVTADLPNLYGIHFGPASWKECLAWRRENTA